MRVPHLSQCVVAGGLGLALVACGSSEPNVDELTPENSAAVGAIAVGAVSTGIAGLNPSAVTGGGIGIPGFAVGSLRAPGLNLSLTGSSFSGPCPAVSSTTDTDGDGVSDNATYTFTAADCTTTGQDGSRLVLTGSFRISDPGATLGYDLAITNLKFEAFSAGSNTPATSINFSGGRGVRGSPTTATLTDALETIVQVGGERVTLRSALQLGFTAAAGTSIDFNANQLPDGTVQLAGGFELRSKQGNFNLVMSSATPLNYDADCATGDIVGGTMRAAASTSQNAAAVQVTYNGCGQAPSVIFVGGSRTT